MLGGEFRPFVRLKIQLREIADLPFKTFAFGHIRRRVGLKRAPPLGFVAPVTMQLGNLVRLRVEFAVRIHQLALRRCARQ